MTTATPEREAEIQAAPVRVTIPPSAASRRQLAIVRAVAAAVAVGSVAVVAALGADSGQTQRPAARFAIPQVNDAAVVNDARGATFSPPPLVTGAGGGAFDDPVVRKGAGGAPVKSPLVAKGAAGAPVE